MERKKGIGKVAGDELIERAIRGSYTDMDNNDSDAEYGDVEYGDIDYELDYDEEKIPSGESTYEYHGIKASINPNTPAPSRDVSDDEDDWDENKISKELESQLDARLNNLSTDPPKVEEMANQPGKKWPTENVFIPAAILATIYGIYKWSQSNKARMSKARARKPRKKKSGKKNR